MRTRLCKNLIVGAAVAALAVGQGVAGAAINPNAVSLDTQTSDDIVTITITNMTTSDLSCIVQGYESGTAPAPEVLTDTDGFFDFENRAFGVDAATNVPPGLTPLAFSGVPDGSFDIYWACQRGLVVTDADVWATAPYVAWYAANDAPELASRPVGHVTVDTGPDCSGSLCLPTLSELLGAG